MCFNHACFSKHTWNFNERARAPTLGSVDPFKWVLSVTKQQVCCSHTEEAMDMHNHWCDACCGSWCFHAYLTSIWLHNKDWITHVTNCFPHEAQLQNEFDPLAPLGLAKVWHRSRKTAMRAKKHTQANKQHGMQLSTWQRVRLLRSYPN